MEEGDLQRQRPRLRQREPDRRCVIEVLSKHAALKIDKIGMLETLSKWKVITHEAYSELKDSCDNLNDREFLIQILKYVEFNSFCLLLEKERYQYLADQLKTKRYTLRYQNHSKTVIPYSKRTHAYYRILKSCVDNDSFTTTKTDQLKKFIHKLDDKIVSKVLTSHERQFAMEKKVAATALLITQYTAYKERKQILESAIKTETSGLDNTSMQIVFHSKMAMTEIQAGNSEAAEGHITQTHILCRSYGPCFAVTCALHDMEYIGRQKYLRNPTKENLDKLLTAGDLAVQSVQDNSSDEKDLWQRICLLFLALSLLFISSDFTVDLHKKTTANTEKAKHILKETHRRSDDIEIRRRMIYDLCQAVAHEDQDLDIAEKYARHALEAADHGGCFREAEKRNVRLLHVKLNGRLWLRRRLCYCKWLIFIIVLPLLIAYLLMTVKT